jgi:hypothetical protein
LRRQHLPALVLLGEPPCNREIAGWNLELRCRDDEAIDVVETAVLADRTVRAGVVRDRGPLRGVELLATGLFGHDAFVKMRPTAYFVTTARGEVHDEAARSRRPRERADPPGPGSTGTAAWFGDAWGV